MPPETGTVVQAPPFAAPALLKLLDRLTLDIETNLHDETDETEMSRPAKNPQFTKPDQADAIRVWGKLWGMTATV